MPPARSKWIALCGAVVLIAAVVASLIPANMQIRTGLHWQAEHFLVYFLATSIFCLAWPRPFIGAGVMIAVSALLEALQGPADGAQRCGRSVNRWGVGQARHIGAEACPGADKANLMYP